MKVHENLSLSERKINEISSLKKSEALKVISSFGLFNGHSTKYAKAENLKIYESINARRSKKPARSIDTSKHKARDRKDNS